jgi:hypothetical protein
MVVAGTQRIFGAGFILFQWFMAVAATKRRVIEFSMKSEV